MRLLPRHGLSLSKKDRLTVYAARRYLTASATKSLGLQVSADVYFQDPLVAKMTPALAFDEGFTADWEPGLADGPTSARFAVADFDGDSGVVEPPARWDAGRQVFTDDEGTCVDRSLVTTPQFRQVHVWALLQRALRFFEDGFGLGRPISWGFEGNRLIIVPAAGYAENAFYDRESKSLQFYYFGAPEERVYTCLSTDIVHHEFGHAVLDGIRPLYIETLHPETAAFHESVGDLTAILIAFRNTPFRRKVAEDTGGDLTKENVLSSIAAQFGQEVKGQPFLRSGLNSLKMGDVAGDFRPHHVSQVLTGAMWDIIAGLTRHYIEQRKRTVGQAFWDTIQRMQRMAIQPLDFLPPVEVTFRDYALAVLRAEEVANPTDPYNLRRILFDAFLGRSILSEEDRPAENKDYIFDRPDLPVFHDIGRVAMSKGEAYLFLDDNRAAFLIPGNADFVIADIQTAQKKTREAAALPRQVIIQYVWREEVRLDGRRFGAFDGRRTSLPCGGTLVFDFNGNLISWSRKPGMSRIKTGDGKLSELAKFDWEQGNARYEAFLNNLERRIAEGNIGDIVSSERGLLGTRVAPLIARDSGGHIRFELTPHLSIQSDEASVEGSRRWQVSS